MTKEYSRTKRIAKVIQKEIAIILQREIKDPQIGIVTVSGVEITRDLAYAKIFITSLNFNTSAQIKIGIQALQDASGFIRNLLGKSMSQRIVPELIFYYDHSLMEGMRISNLMSHVVKNDYLRRNTSPSNNLNDEDANTDELSNLL